MLPPHTYKRSPNPLPSFESFASGVPEAGGGGGGGGGRWPTPTRQYSANGYPGGVMGFISPRTGAEHDFGAYAGERDMGVGDDVIYSDFAYGAGAMARSTSHGPLFSSGPPYVHNEYAASAAGTGTGTRGTAMARTFSAGANLTAGDVGASMVRSISGGSSTVVGAPSVDPRALPPPLPSASRVQTTMTTTTTMMGSGSNFGSPVATRNPSPPSGTPKRRLTAEFLPDGGFAHVAKRISPSPAATPPVKMLGGNGLLEAPNEKEFYYKLVGECYVHGMMNGEAVAFRTRYNSKMPLDGRILVEKFELR
jgi:hypothetical protein